MLLQGFFNGCHEYSDSTTKGNIFQQLNNYVLLQEACALELAAFIFAYFIGFYKKSVTYANIYNTRSQIPKCSIMSRCVDLLVSLLTDKPNACMTAAHCQLNSSLEKPICILRMAN
jgi:hypothetical protein